MTKKNFNNVLDRDISNYTPIPPKTSRDHDLSVVSYNVTADFFDNKDTTPDKRHTWANRAPHVKAHLEQTGADVINLQELSPEQSAELADHFKDKYDAIFLSQTPSDIKPTGAIVDGNNVQSWIGKRAGTPLVGILVSKDFDIVNTGRFWLNENPDTVPINTDRATTDKGFGNMNTYRATLWAELMHKESGQKVFMFNSHYPLSGGNMTRAKCAEVEIEKIREIAGNNIWVSAGDRNIIPGDHMEGLVHTALTNGAYDSRDCYNHYGSASSFTGFTYDQFQSNVEPEDGKGHNRAPLDLIVTNIPPSLSFTSPGGFDPEKGLVPLTMEDQMECGRRGQYFASDHALTGVHIPSVLDPEFNINKVRQKQYIAPNLEKNMQLINETILKHGVSAKEAASLHQTHSAIKQKGKSQERS